MARSLSTAIRELREENGWTQTEFAERINAASTKINAQAGRSESANLKVDQTTVSRWESGTRPAPTHARRAIAHAGGLTLEDFDDRWRADTIDRTDGDESGNRGIPVINRAPAGVVVNYEEYGVDSGQGFTYIDREDVSDPLAFAVIVVGDSMEPSIREGDILVFSPLGVPRPRVILEPQMVTFIRFSEDSAKRGGCCIARFAETDNKTLSFTKDSPKHDPFTVPREDIAQLAVAIDQRRKKI